MSTGYVYLAEGETTRHVKVGYSADPVRRVAQIESALSERLTLIATLPANLSTEKRLHALLAPVRVKGEWYRSVAAVYRRFQELREHYEAADRGVLDPRGIA